MKTTFILLISLCFTVMLQAQISKTANVTAGNLKNVLTADELNTVTALTLTGTIDARDFKTMRDEMPLLAELDLSGITIVAYSGEEGTEPYVTYYQDNEIPDYAFSHGHTPYSGKTSLTIVTLPTSATFIGDAAFYGCSGLTSITIPSTVTQIWKDAFSDCIALTSIYCLGNTPPNFVWIDGGGYGFYEHFFYNLCKTTCILYVPLGSKENYASAVCWNVLEHIVEMPWYMFSSSLIFLEANEGSTTTEDISSNVTWTVNTDQTWLTVNPTSCTSDTTLTFTAGANSSGTSREATVTVSAQHLEPLIITVKQWAATTDINDFAVNSIEFTCYPNPFNSVTTISWQLAENRKVTLKVIDIVGRTVTTLVNEQRPQGNYEIQFNAATLPKGIYFCQLKAGEFSQTRKMVLLK